MRLAFCAAALVLFLVAGQRAQTTQEKERNLSLYDQGGTYEFHIFQDDSKSYGAKADAMREFLWTHWRSHHLGYMVVKRHPIDQAPNTTYYYLEPDEIGVWHLLMRIQRLEADKKNLKHPRNVTEELQVYNVQRAEYAKDANDDWVFIGPDEKRAPGTYLLVISDKNGKILGYQ